VFQARTSFKLHVTSRVPSPEKCLKSRTSVLRKNLLVIFLWINISFMYLYSVDVCCCPLWFTAVLIVLQYLLLFITKPYCYQLPSVIVSDYGSLTITIRLWRFALYLPLYETCMDNPVLWYSWPLCPGLMEDRTEWTLLAKLKKYNKTKKIHTHIAGYQNSQLPIKAGCR